ncbi:MAG TPA: ACP phosphodiesterase [Cyclobacteriaceae bacterium]|nr:ACP phosphodiesterase [Cyclobacteriaceae bacterium]
MNFLAHLYLSGDDPKIMVGNFIGDFVKGRNAMEQFEPSIIRGIELHRAIDEFTDSHPVVSESKNRLRPKYRHYSGVIVDVFYDHFLARNWDQYHTDLLPDFADMAYDTIQSYDSILPKDVRYMMPYMIKGNWLVNYSKTEGIHRALSGMARRTPYESKMEEATVDLVNAYELFKAEFDNFFPQLNSYCKEFLSGS